MAKKKRKKNVTIDDKNKDLLNILKLKLTWLEREREKGLKEIQDLKEKVLKIEGAIIFINNVLSEVEDNG